MHIGGPILGMVFKVGELVFYSTASFRSHSLTIKCASRH